LEGSYIVACTFLMNMLLLQTGIFCRIFVIDICEYVPESALFLWLYKNKLYIFAADNKILKEICRRLSLLMKNTRTPINVICYTDLLTACEQDQDGPSWSCSQAVTVTCMKFTIAVCTVKNSRWWTEEMSETCKVLFQKNKLEKLVHLVGFIIRIY